MKVIQFNRNCSTDGSVEILFNTIRKFIPQSIDVEVFIPHYESQGFFKRLSIVIESFFNQGDINHITGDIHFASLLLKKKKTILTVLDAVSVIHSKGLKRAILKFFWYTLPIKRVQYITVISQKTKEELLSLVDFPEDHIYVIPCCINDKFNYIEKQEFNKYKPRILQVGTRKNKNLIRVCEALKGTPCILDIVGTLSAEQLFSLECNSIEYENSSYVSDEEMIQKYSNADIVAFVSTYEGFGMPILEGQTVGRPVLTSTISPMKEVAGEDGACFVDPYDVEDIRKGIKKLIEDSSFRIKIINQGLENIKKYNPAYIATMYTDLYEKVYERSKGNLI